MPTASTAILYVTLVVTAFIAVFIVLRYDLHRKEPWYALACACALGMVGMCAATAGQQAIIAILTARGHQLNDDTLALIAGTTEELAKFVAVLLSWTIFARWFDDGLDGIVYGSFAGLGAAIVESITTGGIAQDIIIPGEEPIRIAGHLVMGGIGGFGIGLVAVRARGGAAMVPTALGGAIAIHVLWDMVAYRAQSYVEQAGNAPPWQAPAAVSLMLAGMMTYRLMVRIGMRH